ncbi:NUDIX domain-containing protein [Stagonosporopsis vannaccii]|nr:NUDIX domain-containing protein [Stagonosporopsis vannaccii]
MPSQPPLRFIHDSSAASFAVSKSAYLRAHPSSSLLLATSALVLHRLPASAPRILLLQRAPTDSNPNKWEPPGGAVDDDDASILNAVARELWEETGLRAMRIGGLVAAPQLFRRSNGEGVQRFCFAVKIEEGNGEGVEIRLDKREHQRAVWVTEEEVKDGRAGDVEVVFVGEEVRKTVLAAFGHVWDE